jgi:hypothetical protein
MRYLGKGKGPGRAWDRGQGEGRQMKQRKPASEFDLGLELEG